MPSLFDADQLTVRARVDSAVARTRSYELLDSSAAVVGSATQDAGSVVSLAYRQLARSRAAMAADFQVRDATGALLAKVAKRATGLLRSRLRTEVSLADGAVVAVASASVGGGRFVVHQPSGAPLAELDRAGRTLFAVTGPHRERYGTVELAANTRSAAIAGTARPNTYLVHLDPATPLAVRIATVAVVVVFDSLRGA
jgi:hypothetical protein